MPKSCCAAAQASPDRTTGSSSHTLSAGADDSEALVCACSHHGLPELSVSKTFVMSSEFESMAIEEVPVASLPVLTGPSFRLHLGGPPGARGPPGV